MKIRDYPRSCKFYSKVVHSEATAGMSGGKAYNRNKSEDLPEYFCLIRSFRVKGDRINELVNCTWCVQVIYMQSILSVSYLNSVKINGTGKTSV